MLILKALHRLYAKCFVPDRYHYDRGITDPDEASAAIARLLATGRPCMVARYGSVELLALMNYIGVAKLPHNPLRYVMNKQPQWWWNEKSVAQLQTNAGFFPLTLPNVERFCELMLECTKEVDILGSWLPDEERLLDFAHHQAERIDLHLLEPYWSTNPWSKLLEGKRVVVVHPFAETIVSQYEEHRNELFENPDVLPTFASLRVIKAVQSLGGEDNGFKDWFEALAWMEQEIDKDDYDVCLIGCGAYGFPLGAHVKRMGKQAIHLGGALQLLFGIRGNRWEDPMYGVKEWGLPKGLYANLMNEHWVKASGKETPKTAHKVENSCYW